MLTSLTLKCANCGANLEVKSDTTNFACGYCGASQLVERHGGTVSLRLLTDSISKVQVGTDKTAAELAIRRMKEEMAEIDKVCKRKVSQLEQDKSNLQNSYLAVSVIACLIAFCSLLGTSELLGIFMVIIISSVMYYFWNRTNTALEKKYDPQIKSLANEYKSLKVNVAKQKEIVKS